MNVLAAVTSLDLLSIPATPLYSMPAWIKSRADEVLALEVPAFVNLLCDSVHAYTSQQDSIN